MKQTNWQREGVLMQRWVEAAKKYVNAEHAVMKALTAKKKKKIVRDAR